VRCSRFTRSCSVVRAIYFPGDSCVILQLQLFGQLLPQHGGAVKFWMLPSGSGDQLCDPLPALHWSCLFTVFVQHWEFISLPHPLSWGQVQCSTCPLFCPSFISVRHLFFSFAEQFFWLLLSGSRDQLCDPLYSLLQGVAYHPPTLHLHYLSCVCLLIVQHWD
jgi:hypothetical protein